MFLPCRSLIDDRLDLSVKWCVFFVSPAARTLKNTQLRMRKAGLPSCLQIGMPEPQQPQLCLDGPRLPRDNQGG